MSEDNEQKLQAEWRSLIVGQLNSLSSDIKAIQAALQMALASVQEVHSLKAKLEELTIEVSKQRVDITQDSKDSYVTKGEFEPIKNLIYGAVGIILVAVVGAIVTLIIKK
jgi:uncharacterized protein